VGTIGKKAAMNRWLRILVVAAAVWCAAGSPTAHARSAGDVGFTVSVLSDPYPSLAGINLLYHPDSHLRLQVGAGTAFVGSALGAGVRYIFSPAPGWSPVFGVSWTSLKITGLDGVPFFDWSSSPGYSSQYSAYAGMELASAGGFLFGIGLNAVFLQAPQAIGTTVMPGIHLGWLF